MRGIRVGIRGMIGMREIRMGMQGIMVGTRGIRVGMRGIGVGKTKVRVREYFCDDLLKSFKKKF